MRVIIAYDGSAYADAAIDDLPRAGFPSGTEVLVASVADFSERPPAIAEFDLLSAASRRIDTVLAQARHHEAQVIKDTGRMLSKIVHRLRPKFPDWKIHTEVLTGDPAEALLRKVSEWDADLIMGGSHGRSAVGRFFLGSVSKSVAERSTASVRIVRRRFETAKERPVEIVVGVKNPAEAERMAAALGRREWPPDTRIRLVALDNEAFAGPAPACYPNGKSIYQSAAEAISANGFRTSVQILGGDPKDVLPAEAKASQADAIMIPAGGPDGSGLDATALSLVTGAERTVEIVR